MKNEMERLWSAPGSFMTYEAGVYPAMNIYDDGESFVVRAELPGVKPEDIDVSVTGKTLNLRGKRTIAPAGEKQVYHRRERESGEFRRAFELPELVDNKKVMANFTNGVLEILLPRAEQAKQRKVKIQTGGSR